ncbi:MAG: hypothetical protein JKY75_05685 [Erythrobacter sp.]|nr:hypothetical protein [Erythrobacter sp.]
MNKPMTHIIELFLNNSIMMNVFGLVNLESVRSQLRLEGCKRIPNTKRLKRIIREIFDDKITNSVSFRDTQQGD